MKGPGLRLTFDTRRLWSCPRCERLKKTTLEATSCRCACQSPAVWMKLVDRAPPVPAYPFTDQERECLICNPPRPSRGEREFTDAEGPRQFDGPGSGRRAPQRERDPNRELGDGPRGERTKSSEASQRGHSQGNRSRSEPQNRAPSQGKQGNSDERFPADAMPVVDTGNSVSVAHSEPAPADERVLPTGAAGDVDDESFGEGVV